MNTNKSTTGIDPKVKFSLLWILIMFNMVFADILTFETSGFLKEIMTGYAGEIQITQGILLVFAVLLEIPIAMIFLSRVLNYKANRLANIIASAITIMFVVGGGSGYLHCIFFTSIEVVCALVIIWLAWEWKPAIEPSTGS